MKVLQLIDSLEAGGAERVAVNLANVLAAKIDCSFLCATRKEGILKDTIGYKVEYFFLNKKKIVDLKAIKQLNTYVKEKEIQIIHAHSSSFFLATIIKLLNRHIIIVWHDHYGKSEFLDERKFKMLRFCSKYFSHIFSVNATLKEWALQKLKTKNITYLPNFTVAVSNGKAITTLNGIFGKRIVCLANLRPQKDHMTLFKAFNEVIKSYPDWTLHCVGKTFNDSYFYTIKDTIDNLGLKDHIFLYGSRPDVFNVLKQCDIGVLSSVSEGLPIALLEYGVSSLAVIATKVGECKTLIKNDYNGLLVTPDNIGQLSKALSLYIDNKNLRTSHATRYNEHIKKEYSQEITIKTIIKTYKQIID